MNSALSLLLVALLLTGCATATFHPADGTKAGRSMADCNAQHPADPERCVAMVAQVDGNAVGAVFVLVLYVTLIVLIAVAGAR